jgi:tRNA A-37 threonylcarbamoyl transferase component Bud32
MSHERIVIPGNGHSEDGKQESVDALLGRLPSALQQRWSEEIEGLKDEDARTLLESVLERRTNSRLSSLAQDDAEAEDREAGPDTLALRDRVLASSEVLGSGGVADFLADPDNAHVGYKVVRDFGQYSLCNPVTKEANYLEELREFSRAGVRTPRVFQTIIAPEFVAIGMERLPGLSLEQMLELPEKPENFDIDAFIDAMREYVAALREEHHVYHRDLRPGNLMFDPETGEKYLIDFGRARKALPDEQGFIEFSLQGRAVRGEDTSEKELEYVRARLKQRFPA